MSGDVQPRKRKDKKKRKDEGDENGSTALNEDVNIHVHKDGGTGGNICGKIVFFFLFSALIVLIGLIIKENQGLNELEDIESESRFSQIFEGWIDKAPDEHEDHSPELYDHEEGNGHDEDLDEEHGSEESNLDEDTEEDQSQEIEEEDEEEQEDYDSTLRSEEEEGDTEEELYQSQEDSVNEDEDEDTAEKSDEQPEETEETEERDDEEDDQSKEQEDEQSREQENEQSKEQADSKEVGSKETKTVSEEETKDASDEASAPKTKVIDDKQASKEQSDMPEHQQAEQGPPKESSGLATKIGVGVALLTVAYNVFLRKRRSDGLEKLQIATSTKEEKEPTPDLSRRNTIIPPPSLQEVEPDLPDIELEDEEYSDEEYSDEDSRSEHRSAREEYQELRKTYTRSMTPEGDFDAKDKSFEDEVLSDEIEEEELEAEEELEDEEEIDDDYDKYDEDEDEELLKRLEAKYGKLGRDINVGDPLESDSDREDYEHADITNKDDFTIKKDIDAAQQQLDKNAAYANKMFEALLEKFPQSPRLLYGKARALDILAEKRRSNDLLKQSLSYYSRALNSLDIPDKLFSIIAERYIDRTRFIGQYKKAFAVHWQLIEKFPDNATHLNNLAVTYLTINLIEEARSTLKRVLAKWPNDGFALVHYGFILKTADNNLEDSIDYLTRGLKTRAPGVIDGRFYFHLGDALGRLNRNDEAAKIYEEGVENKVFRSKYQRSLYNVERLTAKPWWDPKDIPSSQGLFSALKENWRQIRQEGIAALNDQGYFQDEAENLKDTGTWKQLELFARGQKSSKNCARSPVTCGIIQKFSDASGCRRGQSKFSVMHPGTHVWPHCGPTNCRLRIHLGLKVPPKTFIRVAEETRSWKEGEVIIFDDSFEHEVWHNGSEFRLVLIVDVWHPNLTPTEKRSLSYI